MVNAQPLTNQILNVRTFIRSLKASLTLIRKEKTENRNPKISNSKPQFPLPNSKISHPPISNPFPLVQRFIFRPLSPFHPAVPSVLHLPLPAIQPAATFCHPER